MIEINYDLYQIIKSFYRIEIKNIMLKHHVKT